MGSYWFVINFVTVIFIIFLIDVGDIGHYDNDNFFYIVDRVKELIKVKGFQVSNNITNFIYFQFTVCFILCCSC